MNQMSKSFHCLHALIMRLKPGQSAMLIRGYVLRLGVLLVGAFVLASCATDSGSTSPIIVREQTQGPVTPTPRPADRSFEPRNQDGFVRPRHFDGNDPVRVVLLLPFSAANESARNIASSMFDAAQLAVFEAGDERFLLLPKDTKGTAEGAQAAARSAIQDGAEIILGPLFSESVQAASQVARSAGVPMVAFSSDLKSSGQGVYLLSFPPELEVARITDYSVLKGYTRFGVLAPSTAYGDRVSGSFAEEVFVRGGVVVHEERYIQEPDAMLEPAKRLAKYSKEIVPLEQRHEYDPNDPTPINTNADLGYTRGYQAVLMPEQGTLLRALAPLLPYYNVDINTVKILGISAWNNPRLTREPALRGGWFAAPDPEITRAFEQRFANAFGQTPPRLASLAYDATLLAARLAMNPDRRTRFTVNAITDPNGYFGADGLFRLNANGSIERGLAILEIQPGGIQTIDPAPRSFAQPVSSIPDTRFPQSGF